MTIPAGISSIGHNVFEYYSDDNPNVVDFVYKGTIEQWCSIEFNGFGCYYNLFINNQKQVDINLPNTITTVNTDTFSWCYSLESISIPGSVTSIGTNAFKKCVNLIRVSLPESITCINYSLFSGCSSLVDINIPEGVTTINNAAFDDCSKLESITLPVSVTSIENCFERCPELKKIYYNGTLEQWYLIKKTSLRNYDLYINNQKVVNVVLPEGVDRIEDKAFYGCSSLESITIPDTVTNIGKYAFFNCSNLGSITIPESVTNIDEGAFAGCSGLQIINIPENVTNIGSYAFCRCSGLTSFTIPEGITTIEEGTFESCTNLTNVIIPESVTTLTGKAFANCHNLCIVLPKRLTKIIFSDRYSSWMNCGPFDACSNITITICKSSILEAKTLIGAKDVTLIVGSGINSISNSAFADCESLRAISIPSSITYIGLNAFNNCTNLSEATFEDTTSIWYKTDSANFQNGSSLGNMSETSKIANANKLRNNSNKFLYCK